MVAFSLHVHVYVHVCPEGWALGGEEGGRRRLGKPLTSTTTNITNVCLPTARKI